LARKETICVRRASGIEVEGAQVTINGSLLEVMKPQAKNRVVTAEASVVRRLVDSDHRLQRSVATAPSGSDGA
jgi:hypothetical protein